MSRSMADRVRDLIANHGDRWVIEAQGEKSPIGELLNKLNEASDPSEMAELAFRIGYLVSSESIKPLVVRGVSATLQMRLKKLQAIERGPYVEIRGRFQEYLAQCVTPRNGKKPTARGVVHRFLKLEKADPDTDAGLERMLRDVATEHITRAFSTNPWAGFRLK